MRIPTTLRRCSILLLVLLAMPQRLFAWVDTGHEIIASIAFDEMNPAARSAAVALLKQHPRYEKDLLAGLPSGFDPDRYAFMIAATWPDIVRSQSHPMHFVANHPEWHYIDIAVVQPGYTPSPPATQPDSQPAGPRNILEALVKVTADLRNPSGAAPERAIALCWVLHLCGDLHQPLHASNYYSPQYPDGDRGGNLAIVLRTPHAYYSQINLHALWDQMLGTYRSPQMIGYVADGLRHDPNFTREKLANELKLKDFTGWANESHDLAVTQCYLNGQLETANQNALRETHGEAPSLPADYVEKAEAVAARQAILAGYRTADLLDEILAPQPQ
jgi:hypothetical protein